MRKPRRAERVPVCGGFDGSSSNDWTALRLETIDGWQFTPKYGPDRRPTIWNPAEWPDHKIPRGEVRAAVDEVFRTFKMERLYCDPHDWQTEIEEWGVEYGEEHVITWDTGRGYTRYAAVHFALERFLTDCTTRALTHDGCPITMLHVENARKVAKPQERYVLGKPAPVQKIDAAMASVLCHEAACDARAAGWKIEEPATTRVWR
jgi:hypothetical protein